MTEYSPEISIIIPVYNAEKYLAETLDTLLAQTFTDYEAILINDGSADSSQEVIDRYAAAYPSVFKTVQQKNQGQSAARNNGLKYASGKYIGFLDSDDILLPEYLEKLYLAAETGNAQISVCAFEAFDNKNGEILDFRMTRDWEVPFDSSHSHVFQYSPWGRLIRHDFIKKYGFSFGIGEQMEDGPYCMMIELLAEKTAVVNEILYRYRLYSASTTGGVIKKRGKPKIPYNCLKTAIETVQKNTADPVTLQMLEYCSLKIMAGWLTNIYKNVDKETRRELCSYCRNTIYSFFPNVSRNPYIGLKKLPKLPVSHQAAVRMLLTAYQTNTVYPFSLISSGLLKLKH